MSLSDEIVARRRHSEWVRWERGSGNRKGPAPVPSYKDCRNCSLRQLHEEQADRTAFCRDECPYADLPPGPSLRFIQASLWAGMPEGLLVRFADELGWRMVMDVQMLRESNEAEKLSAMMGVKLLG